MVELLAPAGSREALIAAVESGANAVYLAGSQFGARAYANNFDEDGLREAIHFAHLRDVLINVTVNTIVDDTEIPALKDYLRFLRDAGADALLVQDLGVARIAREIIPDMPLHASTQMTVHSLEGVLALQEMGFTRVVLSRELSLKEIKYICANSDVEIEVFMHGALCVCYSGQCLMSSMIGGRSGNRGRCAQPCRLPYTLVDEQGQDVLGDKAGSYLLSPRDINTIDVIPDLIGAGVASLKIEGRMKRPEYVATVVSTYRAAIDMYLAGQDYRVDQSARDNLAQIFNRDFTTAYLVNRPGKNMMSDRRPNNRGLLIGRVTAYDWDKRLVTVKLSGRLALGDQVDFWVKVGGRVTATLSDMSNVKGQKLTVAEA
ncbi:MAG: U32 family peptidase, partial [Selenomonas sp.]|nr:U32 family peptidase [Selenomonas sp.]